MKTNAQVLAEMKARAREQAMSASPAHKRLERLHRQILRRGLRTYQGYSLNIPNAGDVLMHFDGKDTVRESIRIDVFGTIRRDGRAYRTAREIMGVAA